MLDKYAARLILCLALLSLGSQSHAAQNPYQTSNSATGNAWNSSAPTGLAPGNLLPNRNPGIGTGSQSPFSNIPLLNNLNNQTATMPLSLPINANPLGVIPGSTYNAASPIYGLPPTVMDSFVSQAGANADFIYGDEGSPNNGNNGLPPYYGFERSNRINAGILNQSDVGLTTGHGSYLPDAWGNDEKTWPGPQWDMSGTHYQYGQMQPITQPPPQGIGPVIPVGNGQYNNGPNGQIAVPLPPSAYSNTQPIISSPLPAAPGALPAAPSP